MKEVLGKEEVGVKRMHTEVFFFFFRSCFKKGKNSPGSPDLIVRPPLTLFLPLASHSEWSPGSAFCSRWGPESTADWAVRRIAHCCLNTQKRGYVACAWKEPWHKEVYSGSCLLLRELVFVEHLLCAKHCACISSDHHTVGCWIMSSAPPGGTGLPAYP